MFREIIMVSAGDATAKQSAVTVDASKSEGVFQLNLNQAGRLPTYLKMSRSHGELNFLAYMVIPIWIINKHHKTANCKLVHSTYSPNPNIFLSPFLVLPLLEWNTIPLESNTYVMLESLVMKFLLETMESQLNEILLSNNRIGLYVWYESFHLNENFMEWNVICIENV